MDLSSVTDAEAKIFLETFFRNRSINREIYEKIPEDQFDFRMVNRPDRKSDSPRESLGHQIAVQFDYLNALEHGKLEFISAKNQDLKILSKEKLLEILKKVDDELVTLLSQQVNVIRKITVPWSTDPIPAVTMLWAMNTHEVLHTGWNLTIMDHLGMERFPKLKEMWG